MWFWLINQNCLNFIYFEGWSVEVEGMLGFLSFSDCWTVCFVLCLCACVSLCILCPEFWELFRWFIRHTYGSSYHLFKMSSATVCVVSEDSQSRGLIHKVGFSENYEFLNPEMRKLWGFRFRKQANTNPELLWKLTLYPNRVCQQVFSSSSCPPPFLQSR